VSARLRVGVVGLGLIGGSLLRGLARVHDVRGYDADAATRDAVAAAGFAVAGSAAELARWAEVVAVAVPPRATANAVAGALRDGEAAVFDVASVKAPVVAAVRAAAPARALGRYVPAHPMAGAETGGWRAARPDLLAEAVWAVCPHDLAAPLEPLTRVAATLDPLGARLLFCTPEEHDAAVAVTSHVPHLVANALVRQAAGSPLTRVLVGGAFRDQIRVAASDPVLWTEILTLNDGPTRRAAAELAAELLSVGDLLRDPPRLEARWKEGAAQQARSDERRTWRAVSVYDVADLVGLGRRGQTVRALRLTEEGLVAEAS